MVWPASWAHSGDSDQNKAVGVPFPLGKQEKEMIWNWCVWEAEWWGIYIYLIKERVVTSIYFSLIKELLILEAVSCWALYYCCDSKLISGCVGNSSVILARSLMVEASYHKANKLRCQSCRKRTEGLIKKMISSRHRRSSVWRYVIL